MRPATTERCGAAAADYIKIADVDAIRDKLGSRIVAATGVMNSLDRMRIKGQENDVAIIGTDHYYPMVRNLDLLAGRFFDAEDVQQRHRVALLMERLARRLFGAQEARRRPDHQAPRPAIHRHRHVSREDRKLRTFPS